MANTVIALKKSGTPSSVPSDLANGELAINYADGKLYYRAANGTIASISGNEPNYFGSVNASGTFVIADTPGDILTLIAGDNITITGDAINDTVTISATIPPDENPKFAFDQANLAYAQANAAYDAANNAVTDFSPAFIQANTARDHANASFDQANTATTNAGRAFDQANTATTNAGEAFDQANISLYTAQTGFNQANTATTNAGEAFDQANTSRVHANTAHATANASYAFANSSHIVANAAFDKANTANITADLAFIHANAAFFKANTAVTDFSPAFLQANLAYEQANTARDHANAAFLSSNSVNTYSDSTYVKLIAPSQTISGNLSITGSLSVAGNAYTIDTETLKISDPLIYLAGNNYTSDIVDIGFVANYVNVTGQNVHTGFFRDSATKEYYVFEGYDAEPVPNHIDTAGNNFTISVLNATLRTSNIILGGANAILTIGASFNHANAAHASANAGMAIGNAAFAAANAGLLQANIAYAHANASFSKANAALPNTSGVAFAGNLNLPTGNLAVGIATPNTGARLQVYNTSGNSELWITADNGYDPTLRLTGEAGEIGNEGFSIRYDNSVGDTYFENKFGAVTSYHFLTSVVEALTIHTDGKVGVGETNPQHILDVKGVANVSSALLVNDMNVKPTITAAFLRANNTLANTSGVSFAGNLNFPTGNVVIGSANTTSNAALLIDRVGGPSPNFIIQGDGEQTFRFFNANTSPTGSTRVSWKMANRRNADWQFIMLNDWTGNGANDFILLGTGNSGQKALYYANADTGFVGIGTTLPGAKLTVLNDRAVNPYSFGIQHYNGASFENSLIMGFSGTFQYLGNFQNYPLAFITNNTERMRVDANGAVGIGTTSPQKKFVVSDGGAFGIELSPNDGAFPGFNRFINYSRTTTQWVPVRYEASAHTWYANNGTRAVDIDASGNVGIGITNPTSNLHVVGTANITSNLAMGGGINFGNGSVGAVTDLTRHLSLFGGNYGFNITGFNLNTVVPSDANLSFYTGTTLRMRANSTGLHVINGINASSVLINGTPALSNSSTITTAGALVVPGTLTSNAFIITPTNGNLEGGEIQLQGAGSYDDWSIDSYINQLRFLTFSSNNNLFRIENTGTGVIDLAVDGSVGIGTTSPSAKLDVVGSIQSTGAATFGKTSNITSTNALILGTVSKSVAGSGGQGTIAIYSDDAANQLQGVIELVTTATAGDRRLRINAIEQGVAFRNVTLAELGGNVGIGTDTPSEKLRIADVSTIGSSTWNGGNNFVTLFAKSGSTFSEQSIAFQESGTNIGAKIGVKNRQNGAYDILFATRDNSATNSTMLERVRIAAGGNVGVGTASPAYKLEVNGSFAATTKSFVIDHPTKPDMKLRYGSLEGPENGVYVRGKLEGKSIIELPDYWWNLVDPDTITVNLTPIGRSQDIWVQSTSAYFIHLNQPADCFFTVFAERKDVDKLVVEF